MNYIPSYTFNMKLNKYTFLRSLMVLFGMMLTMVADAKIIINEIMQSNIDCIMDDMHEFPDSWVELYNDSETSASTAGLRIGITQDFSSAWVLPSISIPAKGYYLVYCDKEGRSSHRNHTDFRLESGKGCQVYLFDKNSNIVDKIEGLKKQPAPNISYGRVNDGTEAYGYQLIPSPGAPNVSGIANELLALPVFSRKGGVLSAPFDLDIKLPAGCPEGAEVHYTLDGSEPDAQSEVWTAPMSISSSTVVRAKIICDGFLSPRSLTHSYIFHPQKMTLPIISLVTDDSYFYDEEIGIYTEDNLASSKRDWRRPVNFELFDTSNGGAAVLNQLCETRVKGQLSRKMPLKSLVVYANKRFGEKRLNYEFFPEDAPGLTDWKSIELRNAGNDFHRCYMRDGLLQRLGGRACHLDYQPFCPAVAYVNGKYLGMLNIRSRSNEDYVYTFYDGLEDIDLIEVLNVAVQVGDRVEYDRLMQMAADDDCPYEEFEKVMDIDEYMYYVILNLVVNNQDWPGNNSVMWRERSDEGRWRWICKDMDFSAGNFEIPYDYPTFNWFYDPDFDIEKNWAASLEDTRLFRKLMEYDQFRTSFFTRLCALLGGAYSASSMGALFEEIVDLIAPEMALHRPVHSTTCPSWGFYVEILRNWLASRPDFFYSHTADYYGCGRPVPLSVQAEPDVQDIKMDGVRILDEGFDGKWFAGNCLPLASVSDNAAFDIVWDVEVINNGGSEFERYVGDELAYVVPECDRVKIYVSRILSSVGALTVNDSVDNSVYDLSGRKISGPLSPGVYIRAGKKFIVGVN